MGTNIMTFSNIKIENPKFHYHRGRIFLEELDTDKIMLSNEVSFSKEN